MNYLKLPILLASLFIALTSCEKAKEQQTYSDKAVVEGYLIPYKKITISVTKEIAYASSDSMQQPIEGLIINIADNENTELMIDKGLGIYESMSLVIKEGRTYKINFSYNGKIVEAETSIPSKPQDYSLSATSITIPSFTPGSGAPPSFPVPIEITWTNSNNNYFLVVVENIESNPTPIFDTTRYELSMAFRNEPLQTNFYQLNMRSFNYYGTHRVILFSLNPEYAALYDDNGNSSLNLTTPQSNVDGGLGIFTGINSDTINIEVY